MASKNEGVESTDPFGEVAGESVKGHGGFAFRPADKEPYEAFNAELQKFTGTPSHIALVTPHCLGQGCPPNKTTAELCSDQSRRCPTPHTPPHPHDAPTRPTLAPGGIRP